MTPASVRSWLEAHAGIEPSLLDSEGLGMLVAERMSHLSTSESAYVEHLARSSDEVDRLIAAVAVPETWLFRYPRSYDLLAEFLQRRLAAGATTLRMISVGCATGPEPYAMAMTALHAGWPADRVHIEGVDRNAEGLRVAEAGAYGASSIRTEIPAWAVPFLHRSTEAVCIDPLVRGMVRFRREDITSPAGLGTSGPYDVVFCRNVLIYLSTAARDRLVASICAALDPNGLLFVGHAEQVIRNSSALRAVPFPHAFALQPANAARSTLDPPILPPVTVRRLRAPTPAPSGAAAPGRSPAPSPSQAPRADPPPREEDSIEDARILADAGRLQDAEAMIRAIIAQRGPSGPAMELLGMIRMSVNDLPGAKRMFEQAVYLEPNRSGALLQLALINERNGNDRHAAAYWDRARRAAAAEQQEPRG